MSGWVGRGEVIEERWERGRGVKEVKSRLHVALNPGSNPD